MVQFYNPVAETLEARCFKIQNLFFGKVLCACVIFIMEDM